MARVDDRGGDGERLRQGDPTAWDRLYTRIYPAMFDYARRRLSDAETARDAVAEALGRAVATRDRFPLDDSPDAWCFGILRHVVIDLQRRRYREARRRVTLDPPDEVGLDLETADDHARLRAAFARLDDDERELLELRVVAGLSSEEVARTLSSSPGAVRMAQSRALAKLRTLLEGVPT
ncbi:MAG TPA: sigma-70 family RNA polymerase sigma factor [Acidimicrobiales bacterium]|nr:sigma-70 family RNA polymerase sigma factor [Acidimicrobiales bacterium]